MTVASYRSGRREHVIISLNCYYHGVVTYHIDEKPVLRVDGILIEEKGSTDESLVEEIRCEGCKPPKHVRVSTGLEHDERDRLLYEQADYDGPPLDMRPVLGRRPKAKLEYHQTEHGDCAVTIVVHALVGNHGSVSR